MDSNEGELQISADPSKYVTLPIQYEKIWRKYQTTLDWFWTSHDVYIADDKKNMISTFGEEQRQYILKVLTFMFITHGATLTKELFMNLMEQVEIKEAAYYFGSQADAKKTHSVVYSLLLDELILDVEKKNKLIADVGGLPEIRETLRWCLESITMTEQSFAKRLLSFAALQGIIFNATFVLFSWLKKQYPSMMPGFARSNELIWRDEKLNLSFSCMLFDYIEDELDQDEATGIVKESVKHAKNIFLKALPVSTLGLENELMEQFIESSADKIMIDIRLERIYNKESPFEWVIEPQIETNQTNIPTVNTVCDVADTKFTIDGDF